VTARASASAVVQASVPALYLWGVTILPIALTNATTPVRLMAFPPLLAIAFAIWWERRGGAYASSVLLLGATATMSAALLVAPVRALHQFGLFRGALGVLGWLLFAYTCAAPALDAGRSIANGVQLKRFRIFLVPLFALSFLGFAWDMIDDERAVFVHVAACLLGLYVLTALRFDGAKRIAMSAVAITLAYVTLLLLRTARDVEGALCALGCVLAGSAGAWLESRATRRAARPAQPLRKLPIPR
jgi:hypothetical protein